jgi:hypothetical protein
MAIRPQRLGSGLQIVKKPARDAPLARTERHALRMQAPARQLEGKVEQTPNAVRVEVDAGVGLSSRLNE